MMVNKLHLYENCYMGHLLQSLISCYNVRITFQMQPFMGFGQEELLVTTCGGGPVVSVPLGFFILHF